MKRYTHVFLTCWDPLREDESILYAVGLVRTFDLSTGPGIVDMVLFIKGLGKNIVVHSEESDSDVPPKVWDQTLREGNGDWKNREES